MTSVLPANPASPATGRPPAWTAAGHRGNWHALLAGSAVLAILLVLAAWWGGSPFRFAVDVQASEPVIAQVYFDVGRGVREEDSARCTVSGGDRAMTCLFPLPAGELRGLRFDPAQRGDVRMSLSNLRVTDRGGRTLRRFEPTALGAAQEIAALTVEAGVAHLRTTPGGTDPILSLALGEPLILRPSRTDEFFWMAGWFAMSWLGLAVVAGTGRIFLSCLWAALEAPGADLARWARRYPRRAVLAVGAAAAILSCYPVVFLGRSFVSPNNHPGTYLLYGRFPTLPGYEQTTTEDPKGADLGAFIWQDLPYAAVESHALRGGELPLWNRYNSAGTPLLGQGISMFGDPLHGLVLLAGGAAWAWDAKFVLAKVIFAAAVGLCVLSATGYRPAALLMAGSAPFIGFFGYRFSHPAFFSLCYAPAILLAWLELVRAEGRGGFLRWTAALLAASWMELTSGTVKEAYMLLASLHFAGLLLLVLTPPTRQERLVRLGILATAGTGFLGVTAPLWTTFLGSLGLSATTYADAVAYQIQPGLLLGWFDDIFYARFNAAGDRFNPSANGLVLVGLLFAVADLRALAANRRFLALALGAAGPFALAFGLAPAGWISATPFLNHVYHLDNTFSCALLVLGFPVAGFGLRVLFESRDRATQRRLGGMALLLLLVLLGAYTGFLQAGQRPPDEFLPPARAVPAGFWFLPYAAALLGAVMLWPVATWFAAVQGSTKRPWALLILTGCWLVLHGRHGMHLETGDTTVDALVVNPQPRVDLRAGSPAVQLLRSLTLDPGATGPGPARTVGLGDNFFPGYNGVVGLESIGGTDPLMNPRYDELLTAGGVTKVWGWRWRITRADLPRIRPLLDLLNVRFLLDEVGSGAVTPSPPWRSLATLDLRVEENPEAWPRAFFTDRLERYADLGAFVGRLRTGDGLPFAAVSSDDLAVPSAPPGMASPDGPTPAEVRPARDYRLSNNATAFTVEADRPGVAVLTEAYLPGEFEARVDGLPVTAFRVNHAFRGVFISKPGRHVVSFTYRPRWFRVTLVLALAGGGLFVAGGGGAMYVARHRGPRRHKSAQA